MEILLYNKVDEHPNERNRSHARALDLWLFMHLHDSCYPAPLLALGDKIDPK